MTVYFIRAGEQGPVKIGYARDVKKRLATLQTSHAEDLRVIRSIDGDESDEKWLHDHFADSRIRGEWFDFDPAMLEILPPVSHLSDEQKNEAAERKAAADKAKDDLETFTRIKAEMDVLERDLAGSFADILAMSSPADFPEALSNRISSCIREFSVKQRQHMGMESRLCAIQDAMVLGQIAEQILRAARGSEGRPAALPQRGSESSNGKSDVASP